MWCYAEDSQSDGMVDIIINIISESHQSSPRKFASLSIFTTNYELGGWQCRSIELHLNDIWSHELSWSFVETRSYYWSWWLKATDIHIKKILPQYLRVILTVNHKLGLCLGLAMRMRNMPFMRIMRICANMQLRMKISSSGMKNKSQELQHFGQKRCASANIGARMANPSSVKYMNMIYMIYSKITKSFSQL